MEGKSVGPNVSFINLYQNWGLRSGPPVYAAVVPQVGRCHSVQCFKDANNVLCLIQYPCFV